MPSQSRSLGEFKAAASAAVFKFTRRRSQVQEENEDVVFVKSEKVYEKNKDDSTASYSSGERSNTNKSDGDKNNDNPIKITDITIPPNKNIESIVNAAVTNILPEDVAKCKTIIQSLNANEIEVAARSSYEFFQYARPNQGDGSVHVVGEHIREIYAMKMARRHLVAEKGDVNGALEKMKATIAFREEINVDAMRECFYNLNYEEKNKLAETRKGIEKELSDGKHIVRGHDTDNHAFFIIFPRRYTSFDHDWYLKGKLYSLERAIAYTERISGGTAEKVNVVFDYQQYKADKHEPPLSLIKELLFCLRDHYPERLKNMFFVDAPFRFRAFWTVLKPFIDPDTKRKITFVSGDKQKKNMFDDLVSPSQAMHFMRLDGLKPETYDIEKWTYVIPFDDDVDGKVKPAIGE